MSNTNDFLGFKIMEKLGEGAFSAAYLAVHGKRTVAIKLIEIPNPYTTQTMSKEQLESKEFQENLRQTSADLNQVLRTLVSIGDKKGILRYYDYHITMEPSTGIYQLGILTEYLDNLSTAIGKSGMQVRQVLKMGMDLCDGLQTMQEKGICSGNLKESNIFYDSIKGYRLSDFFFNDILVQSLRPSESYTDYGYRFLAPEAYEEREDGYDFHTDMFTLAILMYKLLNNGLLPFQADSVRLSEKEIRERFLETKSLPVSPFINPPILDILNKASAFYPEQRYASYNDFKSALRECIRQLDLLQLDRYLELSAVYLPVYTSPVQELPTKNTRTQAVDHEPVVMKIEEITPPEKPKITPPPEGIPFTVELRSHNNESPTTIQSPQRKGANSSPPKKKISSPAILTPDTAEVYDNEEDSALLSMPTGEYVLGPHEKELLSSQASFSPYAVDDYDNYDDYDDDIAPAYNYDDEDDEGNSFKNRIAIVLFFLIMVVITICIFLFLPYFEKWISGDSSDISSTIILPTIKNLIKKTIFF